MLHYSQEKLVKIVLIKEESYFYLILDISEILISVKQGPTVSFHVPYGTNSYMYVSSRKIQNTQNLQKRFSVTSLN